MSIASIAAAFAVPFSFFRDQTTSSPTSHYNLTSGTSWVAPAGTAFVKVWAVGAGGSGGGVPATSNQAAGGGGAGGVAWVTKSITGGTTIAYSIGAGGVGPSGATNGSAGGTSSATVTGTTVTGNGGQGGYHMSSTVATGGSGTGGDGNATGGNGFGTPNGAWRASGGGIGGVAGQSFSYANLNGADAKDTGGLFLALAMTGGLPTATGGIPGGSATGFGGGGGAGLHPGSNGGDGLYGGGGGGAGGNSTLQTGGNGGIGAVIIVAAMAGEAAAPEVSALSSTATSATTIKVLFTSGGQNTLGFRIAYQSGGTAPADCTSGTLRDTFLTPYALTGLAGGTQYSMRICAVNVSGTFSNGVTTTATTPASQTGFRYYRFFPKSVLALNYAIVGEVQFRWSSTWQANVMTSNSTGTIGGISAIASTSDSSVDAWKVFEGIVVSGTQYWSATGFSATYPHDAISTTSPWVKVDFGAGNAPQIDGYRASGYTGGGYIMDAGVLEGSSDNISWVEITGSYRVGLMSAFNDWTWTWAN